MAAVTLSNQSLSLQVHTGVRGVVKDAKTGVGIKGAVIDVASIHHNVTSTDAGQYWRLLVPGSYSITVHATG